MTSDNDDIEEVFVELSNDEVEEFCLFYKNLNIPEFIHIHLYLRNQLRWNRMMIKMSDNDVAKISDRCKMKFYRYKHGAEKNKTLLGITGDKDYSILFASLDESLEELRESLTRTNLIKWKKLPLVVAILRRYHKMFYEVIEAKNVRVKIDNFCSTLCMDKDKAMNYEIVITDDVELRELNVDDYKHVNDLWYYKYEGSEMFIKSLIELNGGLGIYYHGKFLVSWILQIECFGLGLLQTVEEHQGKGYAKLLTRMMTRKISKCYNEDTILFASYGKPKTVDLYIRLGYKHVSFTHWFYLKNI